jgi:hypothetical protein
MKLIVNKNEFSKLTRLQIIEPSSTGYAISIPLDDGSLVILNVNIEEQESDLPAVKKSTVTITEDMYKDFMHCFPIDSNEHMENSQYIEAGTNKRVGSKDQVKTRLRLRIEEGLSFGDIVKAAKYEVDWRIKTSTLKENKVTFMTGALVWLNNADNIQAMLERANKQQGTNDTGTLNYSLKL